MNVKRIVLLGLVAGIALYLAPATSMGNVVTTPCGANVDHMHLAPDWTTAEKAAIEADTVADFPGVTVQAGSATKNYNCHSYAWAGNTQWINDPGVYFDSNKVDNMEGHQLTYMHYLTLEPEHSAVDHAENDYTATSKWGDGPVVDHAWDDVPDIYGSVEGIYSSRECCEDATDCET